MRMKKMVNNIAASRVYIAKHTKAWSDLVFLRNCMGKIQSFQYIPHDSRGKFQESEIFPQADFATSSNWVHVEQQKVSWLESNFFVSCAHY